MVGQTHVLRALTNALDADRVHHAFLFTGTRGVGKTTVARILAKSLNCERGVSSTPCGECGACVELDEGRFIDLIEVDAASRARVEETRDLLDNVQYAPTRGRYKVYLIDEVHMFSRHSFNALLKTLEEPPPHVKFLLATTDPQRLPVTILSRCLQFNLRRLTVGDIQGQLQSIVDAESVPSDSGALRSLAIAADGSMRDGLSLLDQAIAFGGGSLTETDVITLLGGVDRRRVIDLLQWVGERDARAALALANELADFGADFSELLAEVIGCLARLAVLQAVPDSADDTDADTPALQALAQSLEPQLVQLLYQIALIGRRDLSLAPDPKSGFEMVLLRMLAFAPGDDGTAQASGDSGRKRGSADQGRDSPGPALRAPRPSAESVPTQASPPPVATPPAETTTQAAAGQVVPDGAAMQGADSPRGELDNGESASPEPQIAHNDVSSEPTPSDLVPAEAVRSAPQPHHEAESAELAAPSTDPRPLGELTPSSWAEVLPQLGLAGMSAEIAANMLLVSAGEGVVTLRIAPTFAALMVKDARKRLIEGIQKRYGAVDVQIDIAEFDGETPAMVRARKATEARAQAAKVIAEDPTVQAIIDRFDGRVDPNSVRPA